MKKLFIVASALALGFPVAAFAATYDYVDTTGTMRTIVADSAAQALAIAPNIALHSGVAIHTGTIASASLPTVLGVSFTPSGFLHTYQYVDIAGNMRTVQAGSPAEALQIAPNIAPNSGVAAI
jgi:hypothetical protein